MLSKSHSNVEFLNIFNALHRLHARPCEAMRGHARPPEVFWCSIPSESDSDKEIDITQSKRSSFCWCIYKYSHYDMSDIRTGHHDRVIHVVMSLWQSLWHEYSRYAMSNIRKGHHDRGWSCHQKVGQQPVSQSPCDLLKLDFLSLAD